MTEWAAALWGIQNYWHHCFALPRKRKRHETTAPIQETKEEREEREETTEEAKKEAAYLIVKNLAAKKMLTYSLKRYFVCLSLSFKEFNLFAQIIKVMELSTIKKIYWKGFYVLLPLRLRLYEIKKKH